MNFIVNAREGNSYPTPQGKVVTISETFTKISKPQTQGEAFSFLGVQFIGNNLIINFPETGNPYAEADGDRTKLGEKTTDTATLELTLQQLLLPLEIKAYLLPFIESGINFAGNVNFKTPRGCTGGVFASFQDRSAVVLAIAAAAGASHEQIDMIGEKLKQLNNRFHGRGDILSYSIECAKTPQEKMPSYLDYMIALYPKDKRPALLESIINTGEPNNAYFEKALTKMTDEELAEDKKAVQIRL